jgi:aminoglycoside 3-N-acetyltransferase
MLLRSILRPASSLLPQVTSNRLKRTWTKLQFYRNQGFSSVDKTEVRRALGEVGIREGDILFVHSSFDQMQSIRATPVEIVQILCDAVGVSGTIVMPTFPMSGLSQDYLDQNPVFDWRRTPSRAGMLTEIFRRMPGTERSLHPTHPVAARGPIAAWLTQGHECSLTPFDEQSPFQKLLQLDSNILRIGKFEAMTFRHLADHLIQNKIPYPIYTNDTKKTGAIGKDGKHYVILTKAHNPDIECSHGVVLDRMAREGLLKSAMAGRVPLTLVRVKQYIETYHRCHTEGLLRHYSKSQDADS